jgi:hypothetical protein
VAAAACWTVGEAAEVAIDNQIFAGGMVLSLRSATTVNSISQRLLLLLLKLPTAFFDQF